MAKVAILIGSHISSAPRPLKEALAFCKAGHEVTIYGVWYDSELSKLDMSLLRNEKIRFVPVLDFRKERLLTHFFTRLKQRVIRKLYREAGIVMPDLFGYGASALLQAVRKDQPDIAIAHSEASLYAAAKLSEEGMRVGIDFEDWFSRDLPEQSRRERPVAELEKMEMDFLRQKSVYTLAPSHSMSHAMKQVSGATKAPCVIYNTFYRKEIEDIDGEKRDRKDLSKLSLHWFSHTIGPGRGLELLFGALKLIETPLEVHLRGAYPERSREYFSKYLSAVKQHDITFHQRVSPTELLSRVAEHDIGLALEPNDVESTDLTVSNKLFQYMLAGCCVIATDTTGQREVMHSWAAPEQIVHTGDEYALSQSIRYYVDNPQALARAKELSREVALKQYVFDLQEDAICANLAEALMS